jgi:alkanesulfonate monooxygenase SsuD/methylene tetrahydromethanopterin reductase-like flavin-dependent oxidoreductase (luciferase family)
MIPRNSGLPCAAVAEDLVAKPLFGISIPQRGALFGVAPIRELLGLARLADANPLFDSAWVGDSLTAKPRPESLTLLGALAGMTERLKLGVGCMASFPVRDPVTFAYQWATLDQVSGGRMRLAACTGLVKAELASEAEGGHWGVPDKQRASRLEENVRICRALWGGDNASYQGKWRSFANLTIDPKPVQQPCPIWITANPQPGPYFDVGLRRAATMGDGWMTVRLFPGTFGAMWGRLQELLREEGRDPETFPNIAYHNINIGPDKQACLEESKRFLDNYYGPVFSPPMVAAWTAAGTPDECVEHLDELARSGAKQITLRVTGWDQFGQYERMVNEVLPRVTGE